MDKRETVRINRYLASAGVGSRRECETLVVAGRVAVNGVTVTDLSTRIAPEDSVTVDGTPVHGARRHVYVALNKPAGTVSTNRDERNRPTVTDLVRPLYGGRLFSIGRLDILSTGLLLFTNDGDTCNRLAHPSAGIEREYVVETRKPMDKAMLDSFVAGVRVRGTLYRARSYRLSTTRRCHIVLTEGKNREIRNVFAHFRVTVSRIHRVRYGPITLGKLPSGQARFLTDRERDELLAAQGGTDGRRNRRTRRNGQK